MCPEQQNQGGGEEVQAESSLSPLHQEDQDPLVVDSDDSPTPTIAAAASASAAAVAAAVAAASMPLDEDSWSLSSPPHSFAPDTPPSAKRPRQPDEEDDRPRNLSSGGQTPTKRLRQGSAVTPGEETVGVAEGAAVGAAAGEIQLTGEAGGQPASEGGGVTVDGTGAGSGGGSTPPSGEQPRLSRVHSGDIVMHPHAIKA